MVDFLTRNLVDRRVLLVASYRTDEVVRDRRLRRLVSELGRHGRAVELELAGLSREETAHLLTGILGARPEWTLIDAVQSRSGGNPFFAEELIEARNTPTLPASLRNVVMLRIDRLSAHAREIVGMIAAGGNAIEHRLLVEAAGMEPAELDAAVAEAVSQQVLVADQADGSLRFRHALLREAVHESLLPGERARMHKALAVALTSRPELGAAAPGHAVFELAEHWWEAREWAEAAAACRVAGEHAASLFAMPEAYLYFERALAAIEREGGSEPPVDLLLCTADAAYLSSEPRRSVDLVFAGIEMLAGRDDERALATCYAMLARNAWAAGDANTAIDALRQGAEVLPAEPTAALAGILAEEARILMLTSHYEAAREKCREALDIARAARARVDEGSVLITLGVCVAAREDLDRGVAAIREGISIAQELGNPDQINRGFANLTHVLLHGSRLQEVVQLLFDDDAVLDDAVLDDVDGVRLSAAGENCADALVRMGRFEEADRVMSRMSERGVGSCVFGPNGVRALIALRTGRLDDAERYLKQAEQLSAGINTVQVEGALRTMFAELHLERRNPAAATTEIEGALAIAAGTEEAGYAADMCVLGVRALVDDHEQAGARDRQSSLEKVQRRVSGLVEEADSLAETSRLRGSTGLPRLHALVAQCHAEASRLSGSSPEAWRAAALGWDSCGEPYPAVYCRWREAEALLAHRGERQRAVRCVQEAWRTSVRIGAPLLRDRLERLAVRARIALDAVGVDEESSIGRDLGLTPREVEVLAQLAMGHTDRQIADELFISRKTASVHVSNLLRKLDVPSRVEAGKIGQQLMVKLATPD